MRAMFRHLLAGALTLSAALALGAPSGASSRALAGDEQRNIVKLKYAGADLQTVRGAKAAFVTPSAEEKLAAANVSAARTTIQSADAQSDREVETGDYVQLGTRLPTLVPIHSPYVTANFKETQVDRILVGQPATIEVDALPGRRLKGRVESFAPGSGSQFSLLPFEPGTGNFTKTVQRVAVRISLDPRQPGLERLRRRLSSTITVRLSS